MKVTIGEKCRRLEDDVRRILGRFEDKGKPAWFDGSHLYCIDGKYSLEGDGTGRARLTKLHNLSADGIFRHFEPCEYTSYNASAYVEYLYREEREKARKAAEEKAQEEARELARQENLRFQALEREVNVRIDAAKTRGRTQEYEITLADYSKKKATGMVYGHFAVRKSDTRLSWVVDFLKTGQRAGAGFATKKDACRFVFGLSLLADWSEVKDAAGVPSGCYTLALKLTRFCRGDGCESEDLQAILEGFDRNKNSLENS